ncbi:Os10g0130132 [Oryza sativa Japonica Group]|uniref:Os10g0130132 protein n=1 Tax=Oryza sativa subsp. japonica TaxID=39947 RepID=A0A0N7KRE0_ORYSJ|nr:hypothetical protein EE612_049857 [Oryza sativa]BAT09754.1 Os10g0130132 [Oryza sativa Japonica Group]
MIRPVGLFDMSSASSSSVDDDVSDSHNAAAASSALVGDTHVAFTTSFLRPHDFETNGCCSSCAAVGRSPARRCMHRRKKSFASGDSHGGRSGTASVYPIIRRAASTSSMSLHGARPVAISMTVQPSAHTSAAGPCSSPRATSGAMNAGVPPSTGCFEPPGITTLAHPKSASLARPSAPTSTLLPLTSPCTTSFSWR